MTSLYQINGLIRRWSLYTPVVNWDALDRHVTLDPCIQIACASDRFIPTVSIVSVFQSFQPFQFFQSSNPLPSFQGLPSPRPSYASMACPPHYCQTFEIPSLISPSGFPALFDLSILPHHSPVNSVTFLGFQYCLYCHSLGIPSPLDTFRRLRIPSDPDCLWGVVSAPSFQSWVAGGVIWSVRVDPPASPTFSMTPLLLFYYRHKLNPIDCAKHISKINLSSTPLGSSCPDLQKTCTMRELHSEYRSADGSCNHKRGSSRGRSFTSYKRLLFPNYIDGVQEPRRSVNRKFPLPSARLVSTTLCTNGNYEDMEMTLALMQWSQFVEHDLVHTATNKMGKCCICVITQARHITDRLRKILFVRKNGFFSQIAIAYGNDNKLFEHVNICFDLVKLNTSASRLVGLINRCFPTGGLVPGGPVGYARSIRKSL